jgi:dTDP-4-amino-4,6-dideoxygalactose transaminase
VRIEQGATEIRGSNQIDVVLGMFRRFKIFYSYDPYTYLSNLAVLAGCQSVVVPPTHLSRHEWFRLRGPYGYKGIAFGDDDLDRAQAECDRHEPWTYLEENHLRSMHTVLRFARFCASFDVYPAVLPFHRLPPIDVDTRALRSHFAAPHVELWRSKCVLSIAEWYPEWSVLLTSSATHALETIAIFLQLKEGDEVIVPSFTFTSTANAFATHGATIVYADSRDDHPNVDMALLPQLITPRTRAVVVVNYGGKRQRWCELPPHVIKIEDAAHCIGEDIPREADFCVVSFHTTKNISTGGEGGMLLYTPNRLMTYNRLSSIVNKGTNQETTLTSSYEWVSFGSAFRMSELSCLFLYAHLKNLNNVISHRRSLLRTYHTLLSDISSVTMPSDHDGAHTCFISVTRPDELIAFLHDHKIEARRHYRPLHQSMYASSLEVLRGRGQNACPNAERWANTIVRLPLHTHLSPHDIDRVVGFIHRWS